MNITIKAIDSSIDIAKNFIQSVITPPLEEVGGLIVDQVRYWRFKNQARIIEKADRFIKDKNIKTRKVSLKMLAPLLENCSLEDDESLQDKWTALLVNTVAEKSSINTNTFASILKEMTSVDAEIFELIVEYCTSSIKTGKEIEVTPLGRAITPKEFKSLYPEVDVVFDNLKRLRLIREIATHGSDQVPVVVSTLGLKFIIACSH